MRRVLLAFLLALPAAASTTVPFTQLYHGMVAAAQPYSVLGTGAITVSGCTTVTVGDLICGNGGYGYKLMSNTAPTTLYLFFHGDSVNFVLPGLHELSMTVTSSVVDTVIMSLTVTARTNPIITAAGGAFAGCSNVNPTLYPGDNEICTANTGYPGHGAFTVPSVGSSYTDYNFGGIVTMLSAPSARTVVANDASTSAYNLDGTMLMVTPVGGGVQILNSTTGATIWDVSVVPGCGSTCAPQSLNWSQTAANKLYFFNFSDNTLRSLTLTGTPPTGFPAASAALYQYRGGNQAFSAGISNGGEGAPSKNDWIGWATQGGTDRVIGITHAAAVSPSTETYTFDFSALAAHAQVYTIQTMSGAGVTPIHVTFTPALVPSSAQAVSQVRFDNGAAGNTALNGQHCQVAGGVGGVGNITGFDCYNVTGNGAWTAGGTFSETCIIAGFQPPPCMRGLTISKGADVTSGKIFMAASIDIGSGNDMLEIFSFRPGVDVAVQDDGHAAQYTDSPVRNVPTYTGSVCDNAAWLAANCLFAGHQDTVEVLGHEYVVFNVNGNQPYDQIFMNLANPSLMLTAAELGGGASHVAILQSTGCSGFCGYHVGCAATAPGCVISTDEDPVLATWAVTAATNASPIRITTSGFSPGGGANNAALANGDVLRIGGLGGNTALNGGSCTISNLIGSSFDCLGSTGNGVYTSGGKFIHDVVPPSGTHQGEILFVDASGIASNQFRITILAKSRSWAIVSDSTQSDYYSQPHANISPDGTRVAFASNFGGPETFGIGAVLTGYIAPAVAMPGSLFGAGLLGGGLVR